MKLAARYSAVVVCALSIASLRACQRNDPSARVAALCDACDRPDLPGEFALAVVQEERLLFKRAYGLADSEHQVPFRTSTVFDFAWAGFLCQLSYYPEHDITTILLVNRNPAGFDVSSKLMGILLDREAPGDAPPDVASEGTEVDLSPERLAEYAGPYQLAHDLMWVERVGDKLMVRFAWGPRAPVYAVGNDLFLGRGFDGRFTFLRGADGTIDRLVFSLSGKERGPFRKLDERATTFRDVASFVGEYSSPELLTTYTVSVKNDRLVLGHLRNEDVVLQQLDRDDYRGDALWCTKIRVIRDGSDRVTGFRLDADEDNVQNLWFAKVPTD